MPASNTARKTVRKTIPTSRIILKQDVRSAKAVEAHRTQERARLRNYQTIEAVAQEQQILQARTREYRKRSQTESRDNAAASGRKAVFSTVSSAPTAAGSNWFVLILVTMFGLIIFYTLVTNPTPTSKFASSLGNWLSLISTSNPIFQKKAT